MGIFVFNVATHLIEFIILPNATTKHNIHVWRATFPAIHGSSFIQCTCTTTTDFIAFAKIVEPWKRTIVLEFNELLETQKLNEF